MENIRFRNTVLSDEAFSQGNTNPYTEFITSHRDNDLELCILSICTDGNTSLSIKYAMIPQNNLLSKPKLVRYTPVLPRKGENFRLSCHGFSEIIEASAELDIKVTIIDVKDLMASNSSAEVCRKLEKEPTVASDTQNFVVIPTDLALSYIKAGAFAPEDFIKVTVSFAKLVDKEDTKAAIEGVLEFLCYAREVCEANNDDDDELTSVLKEAGVHYHSTK